MYQKNCWFLSTERVDNFVDNSTGFGLCVCFSGKKYDLLKK